MTEKLRRDELPIEVRDEVWKIFEEVQEIIPIGLRYDSTQREKIPSESYGQLEVKIKNRNLIFT